MRTQLFEMGLRQFLVRLRAFHQQTELHRGIVDGMARAHSCMLPSRPASVPRIARLRRMYSGRSPLGATRVGIQPHPLPTADPRRISNSRSRSGSCSICDGSTAGSTLKCSLCEIEPMSSVGRRLRDTVVRNTSRSPISCEANRAVPPPSLAEQRRIRVLPQFSTMVCASPWP